MEKQTDSQAGQGRQKRDRQKDMQRERLTIRKTDWQAYRQIYMQRERDTERQRDHEKGKQAVIHRLADIHTGHKRNLAGRQED